MKLRPCPFCGNIDIVIEKKANGKDGYIECWYCGGGLPIMRIKKLIKIWNGQLFPGMATPSLNMKSIKGIVKEKWINGIKPEPIQPRQIHKTDITARRKNK